MKLLQFISIGSTAAFSFRRVDELMGAASASSAGRRLSSVETSVSVLALVGTFVFLAVLLTSAAVTKRWSGIPNLPGTKRRRLIEAMHKHTVEFQKVVVREFEIHDEFLQVLDNYVNECNKALVTGLTKEFKAKLATYNVDWDNFCTENKLRFAKLQRLELLNNNFKAWHWIPPFYRISYDDIYECNINRHLILKLLSQVADSRAQLYEDIAPNDVPPQPLITENLYADVTLVMEILRQLELMTHPLLDRVSIVPQGVLEVENKRISIKRGQQVQAVVVDVADFKHLVQNKMSGSSKSSAAIYNWLKIKTFPESVHAYFSQGDPSSVAKDKTEGNAFFHNYGYEQWVIHTVASAHAHNVSKALESAAKMYHNILEEYCRAIKRGDISRDVPVRIPIDGIVAGRKFIKPHIPLILVSALSLALIRMPDEQINDVLSDGKCIQLCTQRARECALYEHIILQKLKWANTTPCVDANTLNALPEKSGTHNWIREANTGAHRLERIRAMFETQACIRNGGYLWKYSDADQDAPTPTEKVFKRVTDTQIPGIQSMLSGTRFFNEREAKEYLTANERPTIRTLYSRVQKMDARFVTIMEIASMKTNQGYRVAAINAASAYHCGGGVMTGGRHALEEAWCMSSTLLKSLLKATYLAHHGLDGDGESLAKNSGTQVQSGNEVRHGTQRGITKQKSKSSLYLSTFIYDIVRRKKTGKVTLEAHIPVDGCILSPDVAIFRNETDNGYEFLRSPSLLAGVISVAAFNKNRKVADSPVDAPENEQDYLDQVRAKWMAAVVGAKVMGAEVLVIPDVGCGVFMNDPEKVGQMLNDVLKETQGFFKEIIVMGDPTFQDAALNGLKNCVVMTLSEDKPDWNAKKRTVFKRMQSKKSFASRRSKQSGGKRSKVTQRAVDVSIDYLASGHETFNPPDAYPSAASASVKDLTASLTLRRGNLSKDRDRVQDAKSSSPEDVVVRPKESGFDGACNSSASGGSTRQRDACDSGKNRLSSQKARCRKKRISRNALPSDPDGTFDRNPQRPSVVLPAVGLSKAHGSSSPKRLSLRPEKEKRASRTSTTSRTRKAEARHSARQPATDGAGSVIANDITPSASVGTDGLVELVKTDLARAEGSPIAARAADAI